MPLLLLAAALALSPSAADTSAGRPDEAAVKAAFTAYQTALLKQDGARAAAIVDRGTLAYYQRMRDMSLTAPASAVKKLPLIDKLMVIRVRHQVPIATVQGMDGRAMLSYGVTQGWVGKNVARAQPGVVEIKGDRATVEFNADGKPTGAKLGLSRESGAWHVDVVSLLQMGATVFQKRAQDSGLSEDEYILKVVGDLAGTPVPPTIWNPPK